MPAKLRFIKGLLIISFAYITFAVLTYKFYGITTDEYVEYQSGKSLLHFYQTGEESKKFDIPERHFPKQSTYFRGHLALFSFLNPLGTYETFHLLNMLFALPIFLMFYALIFQRYKSSLFAYLGVLALVLTPRFFGDLPANPKDVPFAVFFFLSLGATYFLENRSKSVVKILMLGLLFGLTSSFRLLGVSLLVIYGLYRLVILSEYSVKSFMKMSLDVILVAVVSFCVLTLSLPLLNSELKSGYITLAQGSLNFDFWDNKMLFMGEFLTKDQRPMSYLPVWILISTPLYLLMLFAVSPLAFIVGKKEDRKLYLLVFITLVISAVLYVGVKPVIYNGLRHFLFLVPIITFVSALTFFDLLKYLRKTNRRVGSMLILIVGLLVTLTIRSTVVLFPYHYVYFNELVGGLSEAKGQFDSDYWGATYKESVVWVKNTYAKKQITNVQVCDMAFAANYYSDRLIQLVFEQKEADFVICDLDNFMQRQEEFGLLPVLHRVERDGVTLNVVLDNREYKKLKQGT